MYYEQEQRERGVRRAFKFQRLVGSALLLISLAIIVMARLSPAGEVADGTAILFTLPVGLWLRFTKRLVLRTNEEVF